MGHVGYDVTVLWWDVGMLKELAQVFLSHTWHAQWKTMYKSMQHTKKTHAIRACIWRKVVSHMQIALFPKNVHQIQSYRSHKHGQVYQQKWVLFYSFGQKCSCRRNSHTLHTKQYPPPTHLWYCSCMQRVSSILQAQKITRINENKQLLLVDAKSKRADEERMKEII